LKRHRENLLADRSSRRAARLIMLLTKDIIVKPEEQDITPEWVKQSQIQITFNIIK